MKHLLSINDLSESEAIAILDTAVELARVSDAPMKKLPTLRGRTIVNLFAEDSKVRPKQTTDLPKLAEQPHSLKCLRARAAPPTNKNVMPTGHLMQKQFSPGGQKVRQANATSQVRWKTQRPTEHR